MKNENLDKEYFKKNQKIVLTSLPFILFFFLYITLNYISEEKRKKLSYQNVPEISVDADQLIFDYYKNKDNADAKYLDKVIEVRGVVISIDSDESYDLILSLVSNPNVQQSLVMAVGNEDFVKATGNVIIGSQIKLVCVGDGAVLDIPKIRDCQVININNKNLILKDDNLDNSI